MREAKRSPAGNVTFGTRRPYGGCAILSSVTSYRRLAAGGRSLPKSIAVLLVVLPGAAGGAAGEGPAGIPELRAARLESGAIVLDGVLSELAWQQGGRVERWFEVSPGENSPPAVETTGYLAYDERFLYVGVDCRDPEPARIRAALGDRDDYGLSDAVGVALDTRNDGKAAAEFWVNAGGSQYDAVLDDATGIEDAAPDFLWSSAARVTERGWTVEIRIPFSALRYAERDPEAWRILLQRNYPREFFYQFTSTTIPRGSSCYVCRANPLRGLAGLPAGGRLVATPFATGRAVGEAPEGPGSRLAEARVAGAFGGDVKWLPHPSVAVDATIHPDFAQIESDVAQIGVNERFALFYEEKRPFFLEGRELFATPIRAVHTRTVTAPAWGARVTGHTGGLSYALLITGDEGGGSVLVPGADSSSLARQELASDAWIGRLRRDFGGGFFGLLATGRELAGGGRNRVAGPDFQWRPNPRDTVTGQLLFSRSVTPRRPDLESEWDGRRLAGHAGDLRWRHAGAHLDGLAEVLDVGEGFRADDGFVPQVGLRRASGEAGWTLYPEGAIRRVRWFAFVDRAVDRHGDLLDREISAGASLVGRWSSSATLRLAEERRRAGGVVLRQRRLHFDAALRPLRFVSEVRLSGAAGEAIDYENQRTGSGAELTLSARLRPSRRLELKLDLERRFLDVDAADGRARWLFTAEVRRVKGTFHLSPRAFARLVVQETETHREPSLYRETVPRRSADAAASALFSYRLNSQSALHLGYGDESALTDQGRVGLTRREAFVKISYAIQR